MQPAVGFINITRQCNVDCKRCYLTEAHRSAKERLPLATLEAFLSHPFWQERGAVLIWEGGEPSLVGEQAMREYCREARRLLPHASQAIVTNAFHVPGWLIRLIQEELDGNVETTYAYRHKFSLAGDEQHYQRRFLEGLDRFWRAGLNCTVNIELNAETVAAGTDALAAVMLNSQCREWEVDISVDFRKFLAAPEYTPDSVPVLPLTVSYRHAWDFLLELREKWGPAFREAGIRLGTIEQRAADGNQQFNIACEHRFLTLNPDGTVTTNPLYSDLEGTFLGNVGTEGLDPILANPRRMRRILADRKRLAPCRSCEHFSYCRGGPSHVAPHDGSGECAGGHAMWTILQESPVA